MMLKKVLLRVTAWAGLYSVCGQIAQCERKWHSHATTETLPNCKFGCTVGEERRSRVGPPLLMSHSVEKRRGVEADLVD